MNASLAESPRTRSRALAVFAAHPSPRILAGLILASAAARAFLGGFGLADAAVVAVILLLWPVQEWLIHVFILHYKPIRAFGRTWDFAVPRKHRAHHRDPWRIDLVFIPLQSYLYTPFLVVGLYALLLPAPLAATGILAHFVLALHYEWVHFLVHTRYVPTSARYKKLWRNHRLHHCKSEQFWYGVTMLGGDHILRTHPEAGDVPLSATCRSLGFEEDLGRGHEAPATS